LEASGVELRRAGRGEERNLLPECRVEERLVDPERAPEHDPGTAEILGVGEEVGDEGGFVDVGEVGEEGLGSGGARAGRGEGGGGERGEGEVDG